MSTILGTLTGRCGLCGEHHPAESMCPSHEVRSKGVAWFREYIAELETTVLAAGMALAAAERHVEALEQLFRNTSDGCVRDVDDRLAAIREKARGK